MKARISVGLAGLIFFSIVCVFGQITTGTISGKVLDSSGATIPAAQVVILNEDTGVSRTLQSDSAGRYSAPSLIPGKYRVTAGVQGFQTEVRTGIQLTVGREAIVNFELAVGQVTERVEVTGEAPLVQTTESSVSYLVDDRTIRDLPLNGRDVSQLILLNPGTVQSNNGRGGSAEFGFAKRLSISGMRGEDNSYLLDGTYINDYFRHVPAGPTGALTGVETVQEFQMLTSTFNAQYGRAMGGVFNAVTKSGTNEWHGGAYEFLRNSALDARNFFDRQRTPSDPRLPPFRRNHFGATLGGPVVRDKAFFFMAYEGLRESLTKTKISIVPDGNARQGIVPGQAAPIQIAATVAPFLRMYPLPTPGARNFGDGTAEFIFQTSEPTREDFGQARVDYQLSESDSLFVRFTGNNAERATSLGFPDYFGIGTMGTRLTTVSETHIFSPRLLNGIRLYFNRAAPVVGQSVPPAEPGTVGVPGQTQARVTPGSGITLIGGGVQDPGSRYTTNRFGANDDVNLNLGSHSLQFGGMLERLQFNPVFGHFPYGDWSFSNLAAFLRGTPATFNGTPPQVANHRRGARQWFMALYMQDDWRVKSNLTLNLGIRWEPYTVAKEVNGIIENVRYLSDPTPTLGDPFWKNKSWVNFSPRFGFAWSPFQSGNTSVRGGIGLFYVPVDPSMYTSPLLRSPTIAPDLEITNPTNFPNGLAAVAAAGIAPGAIVGPRNLSAVSVYALPFDNTQSPQALQYSLNIQHQIGANNVVTLGYSGRRGFNLTTMSNYNMAQYKFNGLTLEMPAELPNNYKPNPAYQAIRYITTDSDSWYNGFTAVLQRRFSAGLQAQVSYTFSRATNETDGNEQGASGSVGGSGTTKYPYDLSVNKGLSGYHLQNVFTASYSYDLPLGRGVSGWAGSVLSGWQMTGIVTLQDGQPFGVAAQTPARQQHYISRVSPNLKPGWTSEQIILGGPNDYFTLDAFLPPGPGELGNYGRNTLIGPGLAQWDMGLTKNTRLGERWRLQIRAEAFNMLNRANFSSPGTDAGNQIFTRTGGLVPSARGIRRTVTTSRQLQFGLKLIF
ncbi:MAG: TonB-dependent receptor [Acidobacteria bacterium]|nr:TonB-dependent receptor [Acidobacteriota bacterium]